MIHVRTRTTKVQKVPQPRLLCAAGRGNGEHPPVRVSSSPEDNERRYIQSRIDHLLQTIALPLSSTTLSHVEFEFLTGGMHSFERDQDTLEDWPNLRSLVNEDEEAQEPDQPTFSDILPLVARSGRTALVLACSNQEGGTV